MVRCDDIIRTYIVLERLYTHVLVIAQYKLFSSYCTYLRLCIVLIQLSGQRYIHLSVFKVDN